MNRLLLVLVALALVLLFTRWLHQRRRQREREQWSNLLPDLIDLIILCLNAGLSFPRAWSRTTREYATVLPQFGSRLQVVDREIELGEAPGQALTNLAERLQLDEYHEFAQLIAHTQRYGVGVTAALDRFRETLRDRAQQAAERRARQANVKLLFPTMFCLFPAMLIILLGPAALRVVEVVRQASGR